jgi:hypothetical protein
MSKYHANGHAIKQDWLDKLTLKEIQNAVKKEKTNSKFFYVSIELAQIKCEDVKYTVLYYEEVMRVYSASNFIFSLISLFKQGCRKSLANNPIE